MKNLEKLFLRLNDREQTLLVVAVWVVFLVAAFQNSSKCRSPFRGMEPDFAVHIQSRDRDRTQACD